MRLGPLLAATAVASLAHAALPAAATTGDAATSDAFARAAGNRKPAARALGKVLFETVRPAQILKVRIDGAGTHEVAGLVISGLKFHRPLSAAAFTAEVVAIVESTFAASSVEEADVWATVPIPVGAREIVAGDLAQPTSRIVYAATVRRSEAATFARRLSEGRDVYWDAGWKATLAPR